ncbi:MAG: ABC transporter permease [Methanoregula sp.]|uniref:ABC transporter permease n=1 Tax=Methanoregula sp. TaxID=2052170 RepID=UPI0025D5D708|nr:ABC transporter permease [Methanoregula sp.]MCK9632368.1 ABC transporter permease [Methanoregula sp.]
MQAIIIHRILQIIPVLLGISIITFLLVSLAPGDPAEISLKAILDTDSPSPEAISVMRAEMGLDQPLHIRYFIWLSRVVQGDLGFSYLSHKSTVHEILYALPTTFYLAALAMSISIIIGIPLGIAAAVRQNGLLDHFCRIFSVIGNSTPEFFIAIILLLVFAINLKILPVAGSGGFQYFILPSVVLAIGLIAITSRIMRTSMLDVLEENYILTARSKGLDRKTIITKHAIKNALLPVMTYMGTQFGWLFGGAVIVESIFALPGIGRLTVEAVETRDIMILQGCMITFAIIFVVINLVVDLSYIYLNPAIKYEEV